MIIDGKRYYKGWEIWPLGDGSWWWATKLGHRAIGESNEKSLLTKIDLSD